MHILYISKYAAYNPFGMDTRHIYLSREMVRQGHDVSLMLSDSNHNLHTLPTQYSDTVDGVKVRWIKTLKYKRVYGIRRILSWFSFERKLRIELKRNDWSDLDVVIISSLSLLTVINGIYLKRKHGCKLVFEVRDIWPLVLNGVQGVSKRNPVYWWLQSIERRGYREADLVVGTMPNLSEHVKSSIAESKTTLWIPHLMNPQVRYTSNHRYQQVIEQIRSKDKMIVAYAGSINRSSNIRLLMDAANKMHDIPVHFVVLGEGPLMASIREQVSYDNVSFFNKIDQEEVLAFLKDCDVLYDGYTDSQLYDFGNSRNKYVEYCLAAKPIILSYGGYPLFVTQRDCGITVEPESVSALVQGITDLVNKPEGERIRMGQNAISFAHDELNVESHVTRLIEALNV